MKESDFIACITDKEYGKQMMNQLQKIFDINCDDERCSKCMERFDGEVYFCPKSYAHDYKRAIQTIKSTAPIIDKIIKGMER